jgi:hypothetical protein
MRFPWRIGSALALASLALAGCSNSVNLIARRAHYDQYLDLPARGQAVADQDAEQLRVVLAVCEDPDQAPYPLLQADLDSMRRQAAALALRRSDLASLERGYDAFAESQGTVTPDDGAAWDRYRSMNARFEAIGEGMRQSLQALNQSHADFNARMQDAGIAQVDVAAVRTELDGFGQDLDQGLDRMDRALDGFRHRGLDWEGSQGDGQGRWEAMRALAQALRDDRDFARRALAAAEQLRAALPDQGAVFFGPGLPGGDGLLGLRQNEAELRSRAKDFEAQRAALDGQGSGGQPAPDWQSRGGQDYQQGSPGQAPMQDQAGRQGPKFQPGVQAQAGAAQGRPNAGGGQAPVQPAPTAAPTALPSPAQGVQAPAVGKTQGAAGKLSQTAQRGKAPGPAAKPKGKKASGPKGNAGAAKPAAAVKDGGVSATPAPH